jgi:hypothetical protein
MKRLLFDVDEGVQAAARAMQGRRDLNQAGSAAGS